MAKSCERGVFCASCFLSLAEQAKIRPWVNSHAMRDNFTFWGGYENAERARLYMLCDYMQSDAAASVSETVSEYGFEDPTVCIRIEASGFRVLSHRDYMGSVLSLGIEREAVGDIVVCSEHEAYLFCDRAIGEYILTELKKVANDAVKLSYASPTGEDFGKKEFAEIRDTVQSGRFDAIVACVCSLSRENAKKLVTGGMCELNFVSCTSPDTELKEGDVFSVRGYGRYKLFSYDGENRRGRERITVHKYV